MDIELPGPETGFEPGEEYAGKINRYVLSGDLLAGRVTRVIRPDGTEEVKKSWYHMDHLNSTKCVTDADGVVEVNYVYRAFGEQLRRLDSDGNGTGDTAKYSYGGKELDAGTELYYYNARYYDATIGRFINVDPVQDGSNWYVYCANNPLKYVDPTGLNRDYPNLVDFINIVAKEFKIDKPYEELSRLPYVQLVTSRKVEFDRLVNASLLLDSEEKSILNNSNLPLGWDIIYNVGRIVADFLCGNIESTFSAGERILNLIKNHTPKNIINGSIHELVIRMYSHEKRMLELTEKYPLLNPDIKLSIFVQSLWKLCGLDEFLCVPIPGSALR
ncbi:MAG: RHS repeat-associated core domain-containing protein [Spirochaetales bacterium]|nr:RHS repeat-associated core domain-containing protein [Spirochaetales bacterium]